MSPAAALVAHSAVELGASLPWRDDGRNIGPRLSSKMSMKTSAANQLIGEVVQSRRRPLLGPSPG